MKYALPFNKNWYYRIKSIVDKRIRAAIKDNDFEELDLLQQWRRAYLDIYKRKWILNR